MSQQLPDNEKMDLILQRLNKLELEVEELKRQNPAYAAREREQYNYEIKRQEYVKKREEAKKARKEKVQKTLDLASGGNLLARVGIGLVLLAVVFFFLLSIERGWLTEEVQIGIGLLTGSILLAIGYKTYKNRKLFGQILEGGGVAAFYITAFVGFQIYDALLSYPFAFGLMIITTVLTFSLSIKQSDIPLSFIGTIGGLGTPFILYTETGTIPSLLLYTYIISIGAFLVYSFRGWKLIHWTYSLGGIAILIFSLIKVGDIDLYEFERSAKISIQLAICGGLFLYWLLPILRKMFFYSKTPVWMSSIDVKHTATEIIMTIIVPLTMIILTLTNFDSFDNYESGAIFLGVSFLLWLVGYVLWKKKILDSIAYTHFFMGVVLFAVSSIAFLEDYEDWIMVAMTAIFVALNLIYRKYPRIGTKFLAYFIQAGVIIALFARFGSFDDGTPFLRENAIINLISIAGLFAISFIYDNKYEKTIFRSFAHLFMLIFLWHEFDSFQYGVAMTTIFWGVYAIGLLLHGLIAGDLENRWFGMIMLFVVVGKLLIYDLSNLEKIWRILLFLGFGVIFLVLSYFYRNLMKNKEDDKLEIDLDKAEPLQDGEDTGN